MNKKKVKRTSRSQSSARSKVCDKKDVSRSSDIQNQETNDPAWYAQSPELLRDSSSIPFSWPTGTPIHQCKGQVLDAVPGIATLYLKPTVGSSKDQNSAINVASSAVYSFVRHANSGHSNYDAPDLMIYLLAISQVYSFITWCQRLLGLLMAYDQRNRYIPRIIFFTNNVDPDDMLNHIADFRFWLNTFINKVSSFAVPATLPIFNRMAFQFSNYYTDGPSIKDQLYQFAPYNLGWFKFSLNDSGVGQLLIDYMPKNSKGRANYNDITTYGNSLFNAIWAQEDFGIMSGDILKAYGNNIIKLAPVPEMLVLTPMYDTMFLHQFKNAKIRSLTVEPRVTQNANDGYLISLLLPDVSTQAEYDKRVPLWSGNHILSSDFDNPTPEVVIESTRLMPAWNDVSEWFETGVELPVRVGYAYFSDDSGSFSNAGLTDIVDIDSASPSTILQLALVKQFKYAPEVDCTYMDGSDRKFIRYWDIDNYAVLSNDDLEKMHTAALMSMYAVPSIAKIQ